VYAYTGEMRAGMTGAARLTAWPFSGTTGLLPGSAGSVPVAAKRLVSALRGKEIEGETHTDLVDTLGDPAGAIVVEGVHA
jgi:hypothetical protein